MYNFVPYLIVSYYTAIWTYIVPTLTFPQGDSTTAYGCVVDRIHSALGGSSCCMLLLSTTVDATVRDDFVAVVLDNSSNRCRKTSNFMSASWFPNDTWVMPTTFKALT